MVQSYFSSTKRLAFILKDLQIMVRKDAMKSSANSLDYSDQEMLPCSTSKPSTPFDVDTTGVPEPWLPAPSAGSTATSNGMTATRLVLIAERTSSR
jgi:hypothetical protein